MPRFLSGCRNALLVFVYLLIAIWHDTFAPIVSGTFSHMSMPISFNFVHKFSSQQKIGYFDFLAAALGKFSKKNYHLDVALNIVL